MADESSRSATAAHRDMHPDEIFIGDLLRGRGFDHRLPDAQRTIATFGATLQSQLDMTQLNEELLVLVDKTLPPLHASLWLSRNSTAHTPLRDAAAGSEVGSDKQSE
jgi:hypothetical protein